MPYGRESTTPLRVLDIYLTILLPARLGKDNAGCVAQGILQVDTNTLLVSDTALGQSHGGCWTYGSVWTPAALTIPVCDV